MSLVYNRSGLGEVTHQVHGDTTKKTGCWICHATRGLAPVKPCHNYATVSAPGFCQNWWYQPPASTEFKIH